MSGNKFKEFYQVIKESKEFDVNYYISKYPDVEKFDGDPICHYIKIGAKKMYNPSPDFNTFFYIYAHGDILRIIKNVGFDEFNPFVHYIRFGKSENRLGGIPKNYFELNENEFMDPAEFTMNKLALYQMDMDMKLKKIEDTLDSINLLNNLIFSNFHIEAKGILRLEQLLTLQLLRLFDKIFKKYDIDYWLDAGTLLGAVRHGGFIPWDDDIDIGMIRKDFNRFLKIFPKELDDLGLSDKIEFYYHAFDLGPKRKKSILFAQIILKVPLANVDVFIYDNVEDDDIVNNFDNYYNSYRKLKKEFRQKASNSDNVVELANEYSQLIKTTEKHTDYIVSAVDSYLPPKIHKSRNIYPINEIIFENCIFKCPAFPKNYLDEQYDPDFMKLPNIIFDHNRVDVIMNQFTSEEELKFKFEELIHEFEILINNYR